MSHRQTEDEELGFIGAAAAALPTALKGIQSIGKIFKKKKKKHAAATNESVAAEVKNAASVGGNTAGAVQAIAESIPGPVHQVVVQALKAQSLDAAARERAMRRLTNKVDASLKPKVTAMLAALKAQELQRKATYEHNKIVNKAKFKRDTLSMLQKSFDKLSAIEARLGMSTVVPPSKVNVFGNRTSME